MQPSPSGRVQTAKVPQVSTSPGQINISGDVAAGATVQIIINRQDNGMKVYDQTQTFANAGPQSVSIPVTGGGTQYTVEVIDVTTFTTTVTVP
jgi:hypothetical protein